MVAPFPSIVTLTPSAIAWISLLAGMQSWDEHATLWRGDVGVVKLLRALFEGVLQQTARAISSWGDSGLLL